MDVVRNSEAGSVTVAICRRSLRSCAVFVTGNQVVQLLVLKSLITFLCRSVHLLESSSYSGNSFSKA